MVVHRSTRLRPLPDRRLHSREAIVVATVLVACCLIPAAFLPRTKVAPVDGKGAVADMSPYRGKALSFDPRMVPQYAKIAEAVHDPATAALLTPTHVIGCKRLCVDTGYYETFNRPNVTLVDSKATPIERITPGGIRTSDAEYAFDIIIYATGFDALRGASMARVFGLPPKLGHGGDFPLLWRADTDPIMLRSVDGDPAVRLDAPGPGDGPCQRAAQGKQFARPHGGSAARAGHDAPRPDVPRRSRAE